MIRYPVFERLLPGSLDQLTDLAKDLRWSSSQAAQRLWRRLDPTLWDRTGNPTLMLQNLSDARMNEAASDAKLLRELDAVLQVRERMQASAAEATAGYKAAGLSSVAYFSMEFGLSEALPLYAGGLGILAGDHLKSASDLGVPITGIGLLYDQGYFEQVLTPDGWQIEAYPYHDPTNLPIRPADAPGGGWLRIPLELPGRTLLIRVWTVTVGGVTLYLLDSNDPLNNPWDRALTDRLYGGDPERRLAQELILGVGGWRLIEALDLDPQVCHLNEGHAAFVILARARAFMERHGVGFEVALRATRAGNVFTTHTPVAAGFDRFDSGMVRRYLEPLAGPVPIDAILQMGSEESNGKLNMAFLATRGSGAVNGVSRLHGSVSRGVFAGLFPRWPLLEIPVGYVTNAIHLDSWSSPEACGLWSDAPNPDSQRAMSETNAEGDALPATDEQIFACRIEAKQSLIAYVRTRLARQMEMMGAAAEQVARAREALDPNALTLGFARRFASYKRPTLLLRDIERLKHILLSSDRPAQLIVAGKAHPSDDGGKRFVQEMVQTTMRPDLAQHIVFLTDYDIALTQHLAAGVDVWVNTPRRPMEASGTSGMKVLGNGGLNLSELDGWWAEAYTPEVGWALGDGQEHSGEDIDGQESEQLYAILEQQIVPEFYDRDASGLPRTWLRRVRTSMTQLTARFSGTRMVREYADALYLPAATGYVRRSADGGKLAQDLQTWHDRVAGAWGGVHLGNLDAAGPHDDAKETTVSVVVTLGTLSLEDVTVQLFADATGGASEPELIEMTPVESGDSGVNNTVRYHASIPAGRMVDAYTPRVIGHHPEIKIPLEADFIAWYR